MTLTRREFLKSLGNSYLLYAISFVPGIGKPQVYYETAPDDVQDIECRAYDFNYEYRDCIVFDEQGHVTLFCGRTELGQGITTVLTALVTQGLDISIEQLTVILGNTDVCPDHGPTVGSAATELIAWGIWNACLEIRSDLIRNAAHQQKEPVENMIFKQGGVQFKNQSPKMSPFEIHGNKVITMKLDPQFSAAGVKKYKDLGLYNVNAEAIVTGTMKYSGDMKIPKALYADWFIPPYHPRLTHLKSVDLVAAQMMPGVKSAEIVRGKVLIAATRYHDVVKALKKVKAEWAIPTRSKTFDPEKEIRGGAKLERIIEEKGDVEAGLASSYKTLTETYVTHYTSWAQLETDTALAKIVPGSGEVLIWTGSQWPHYGRKLAAEFLKLPESAVHFYHTPVGGCFGGKVCNPVGREAAELSRKLNVPIKMIYSRKNQFQKRSLYKMACVLDLTTGVGTDGRILSRKIDIHQDLGEGTQETYYSPNTYIRHFKTDLPFNQANSRGTSYVQIGFAVESHMDMLASSIGMDPVEFRCLNFELKSFIPLINTCADMIGYTRKRGLTDWGIGFGICNHGGRQMGAVAARVKVDRNSGKIHVSRICGAFDIGTVINHRTATAGIRGAIIWGLGYALMENIKLDGHGCYTEYLSDYKIPRFSDIPPIDIEFLDNQAPGAPRGCGELPVIPTIAAITNAVYHAVGIRFYSTPITPEKVLMALGKIKK